jgi:hypothetical protein
MNRLSIDIYNVDQELPNLLITTIEQIITLFGALINFFVAKAYIYIPVLIVFGILVMLLNYIYLKSMRELTRYQAVSRSPILSFIN